MVDRAFQNLKKYCSRLLINVFDYPVDMSVFQLKSGSLWDSPEDFLIPDPCTFPDNYS